MEQHYVFLKDNRVANIAVFASQDEALADAVAREHGFDDAVWVSSDIPTMWSTYNGTTFTPPTDEYLFSIGVLSIMPPSDEEREQMRLAAKAKFDSEKATEPIE
jgi:hypothetical protein